MDILSPTARRRCNCITASSTVALLFFYLAALLLYYSIGIWIPQKEQCFVNATYIRILEYVNPENHAPEKHFTLCHIYPDLTAKTPESSRVAASARQSDVPSSLALRARDGAPGSKHSRDPPQNLLFSFA